MTSIKRSLLLHQALELIFDEAAGGASVKAPTRPRLVRVTPSSGAEYVDTVYSEVDQTAGVQVDDHGITLDGAWLFVENLGDQTDNIGQLGIWDADPAGAGVEIGVVEAGERFGPMRLGVSWSEVWLKGDAVLARDVTARVVLIES